MTKCVLWVSSAALAIAAIACEKGSDKEPTVGGGAGAGGESQVNSGSGGAAGDDAGGAGAGNAPVACGKFSLAASTDPIAYTTDTLQGTVWGNHNTESSISIKASADGSALCASGDVVRPAVGWGWAFLALSPNGVLRRNPNSTGATDSWFAAKHAHTPQTDGLLVDIANQVVGSKLRVCLQGIDYEQWCADYSSSSTAIPWSAFVNNWSSGKGYAREPLYSIQITVPDQGLSSPFDFCVNSIVEVASFCDCPSSTCNCPVGSDPCNGTCVLDMATNPSHCGACRTVCDSTAVCQAGKCNASLYENLVTPYAIAVDDTYLYFTEPNAGQVMRATLASGAPEAIASGQTTPANIALAGGNVVWVNAGTPSSDGEFLDCSIVALSNGNLTTLAAGQSNVDSLVIDANYAYWSNAGTLSKKFADGAIMRVGLTAGGTVERLVSGRVHPRGVTLDANSIYWAEQGTGFWGDPKLDGNVMKLTLGEAIPVALVANVQAPLAVAVDANNVYYSTVGGVYKVPLVGGEPTVLATGQSQPVNVAVDATNVYWTNEYDGSLMRVPVDGGKAPVALARGQSYGVGLALDATNVYWITQDGTGAGGVLKTTK